MKKANRVGEKWMVNGGHTLTIINYRNNMDCDVVFEDGTIVNNIYYNNIVKGRVKNPYSPVICGVGYLGTGKHKSRTNGELNKCYETWSNMLKRCYDKRSFKKHPSYIICEVEDIWHNFQNFGDWFEKNYHSDYMEGWQLDKDVLFKGNKIYSPETCCFLPREINITFAKSKNNRGKHPIGVCERYGKFSAHLQKSNTSVSLGIFNTPEEAFNTYKNYKEGYIKELADKWKHLITKSCYEALYLYSVDITD